MRPTWRFPSFRLQAIMFVTCASLGLSGCWEKQCDCTPPAPPGSTPDSPPVQSELPQSPERDLALLSFHETCVKAFINQPGFGISRLGPLHRPGQYPMELPLSVQPYPLLSAQNNPPADPGAPPQIWKVAKLELIGIARHPDPVVFPDGKPLGAGKNPPTRSLDELETASLSALRKGSPLEIKATTGEIRVVGPIRSRAECVQCHQDRKDDLLGAFSYVLRPEPAAR